MQNQSPISQRRWGFVLWALILVVVPTGKPPSFSSPLMGEGRAVVIISRDFRRRRLKDSQILYNIR